MHRHGLAAAGRAGRDPRRNPADGGRGGAVVVDGASRAGGGEADLVALSTDALVLTDTAGKISTANPAAARLLNVPLGALPGHLLAAQVALTDRRTFRANLRRAARRDELRFSFDVVPRGLEPRRLRARVVRVDAGLAWSLREVVPEQAVGSGMRLGQALDGIRDGIVVVDPDLRVRFVNRAARLLLAPSDVHVDELVPDPWPTSLRLLVTELLEHDALSAEALVQSQDDSTVLITAYQGDEGEGAVILLADITVDERRERAERDFIANAAHELQSPLTAISNAVEILLAGAHRSRETRLRFLQHVADANDRLSRLLQSLLLLAEAQSGVGGVTPAEVELRSVLEEVVAQTPADDQPRVDIVCPADVAVVTHRGLLEHALFNLVSNALQYGGDSRVVVTGRRRVSNRVVIDVVDGGPGLTRAERAQAFDRFYRAGARDGRGFGLGLSIVQEAARALGGDVELLPNPRGGLVARLTIGSAT